MPAESIWWMVDTINHLVDTNMELQPGIVVLGMVLDTLSGRSSLYRLKELLDEKDTELLLGEAIPPERFTDHNIGRALDKMFETGTQKIVAQLSQNAVGGFQIKPTGAHYDTTSISVYGDYHMTDEPFEISYGHSKDKRPDLKQFLIEINKITAETYFCEADAQAAAEKLSKLPKKSDCFLIDSAIREVTKYRRGRPKNGEERIPEKVEYQLEVTLIEDESKVEILRKEAGCFVLLSNLNSPGVQRISCDYIKTKAASNGILDF